MPVEHTWWEAGVRCSLFSSRSIRFGSNAGWPASMRRLTQCSKHAPSARCCAQAQRLCRLCCFAAGADTMDDSSGPTEAGLGVGHHRELRGLEGILEASSTLLLHEQRAVRQPDLFMHSTWSLRDDYHSRHLGPSMGSAVHGMRRAEAARELREAAILAPLVPFDDGTRLWRAFELGQPGAAIDCTAALRAGAVHRAAVTSSLGHGRRSPRGAWRSQCTAARARHARLGTTPAYFAPLVTTRCTATDQSLDRSTFCGCTVSLDGRKVLRLQGAVVLRLTLYYAADSCYTPPYPHPCYAAPPRHREPAASKRKRRLACRPSAPPHAPAGREAPCVPG